MEQQLPSPQIPFPILPPPQEPEVTTTGAATGDAMGVGAREGVVIGAEPLPTMATSAQLMKISGAANGVALSYSPQIANPLVLNKQQRIC